MNEVERMYENAGVKADRIVCYRGFDNCIDNDFNCHCHNKKPCKDATKKYPPFTAEKQLELIKFLFNHNVYYDVDDKGNYWFHISDDCYTYHYDKFEIALANIINEMGQSLSEEERQYIKNILESEVRE